MPDIFVPAAQIRRGLNIYQARMTTQDEVARALEKHGDDAADKLDFMLNDWSLVYTSLLIDRGNVARAMIGSAEEPVDFVMVLAEELAEAFEAMRAGDFEAAYHEFAQVAAVVQLGMAGLASRD